MMLLLPGELMEFRHSGSDERFKIVLSSERERERTEKGTNCLDAVCPMAESEESLKRAGSLVN